MTQIPSFTAHDGLTVPQVGLGTYRLNGYDGVKGMVEGARIGYRLLDSAFNYENEGALGKAVAEIVSEGIATRDELTVVSKLAGRHHTYDKALLAIEESLMRASLDSYDLFLIHWPLPNVNKYVEAWSALIEAQKRGYVKHIGVCNFLPEHLDRLEAETGVIPALNQVELHPYFPQTDLLGYHQERGIVTQGWAPLGRAGKMLQDPVIAAIADAHGKTVPQVILRWATQVGVMPIPKSSSPERQKANLFIFDFELTGQQLADITALGRPDGRILGLDPATHEEF